MLAGLVDSFFLSLVWTIVVLHVLDVHGLVAAGALSTAMLAGVALSAPVAEAMARRLAGKGLLRTSAGVEAALRLGVFGLVFSGAPLWILAVCVTVMNVMAWTGYAGMRAEVSALSGGAGGLARYGSVVAAVEAAGIAVAALLPTTGGAGADVVLVAAGAAYVLALLPTAIVAGGSLVPRSTPRLPRIGWPSPATVSIPSLTGVLLMFLAAAPTLLSIPLAAELHGRSSVGVAAIAFTLGSLASPALAAAVQARGANGPVAWICCGVGMLVGWCLAPISVALMCLAQLASGLGMTALEGLLDARATETRPHAVTASLAQATAGRALGAAGGTALLPYAVAGAGIAVSAGAVATILALVAVVLTVSNRRTVARVAPRRQGPEPALVEGCLEPKVGSTPPRVDSLAHPV